MAIHNVADNTELVAALAAAVGGDTIVGAEDANLGDLNLSNASYSSAVTITSANTNKKARINKFTLTNCDFITFDDLDLTNSPLATFTKDTGIYYVYKSNDIKILNCPIVGENHPNNQYGTGRGVYLRETNRTEVSDCTITGFARAIKMLICTFAEFKRNEVTRTKYDMFQMSQLQDCLFEKNWLHGHHRDPADLTHPDMFQFQAPTTVVPVLLTARVYFYNNLLDIEDGDYSQYFLIQSERALANNDFTLVYDDIRIWENVLFGRQTHGGTMSECKNSSIKRNTMVQAVDNDALATNVGRLTGTEKPKINVVNGMNSNIDVEDNVACGFSLDASVNNGGVNNYVIDPSSIDDYDAHFDNVKKVSGAWDNPIFNDWRVKAGGGLALSGAGVTDMAAAGPGGSGGSGGPPAVWGTPGSGVVNLVVS